MATCKRGNYIIIDGPDGCGKTTLINQLKQDYPDFVYVKEPGDSRFEINTMIRQSFLHGEALCDATRLHLMIADRLNLQHFINKQLELGKTIISDRGFISTFAYQRNLKRGIDSSTIIDMHKLYLEGFKADAYVLLDIEPKTQMKRLTNREQTLDNMEIKGEAFFEEVIFLYRMAKQSITNQGYKAISEKIHHLDANRDTHSVYSDFTERFL